MVVTRTAIIAGNWKMNYGPREASSFATEIIPALGKVVRSHPHILSILCPPAISLSAVREVLEAMPSAGIALGAQNMYYEEQGAFTGEIAPEMVKELCSSVILGHSERRSFFGETDEIVNKKTHAALAHQLQPIVCVGEDLKQYESGQTESVIQRQIRNGLSQINHTQAGELVIAYEPLWAIGSGKAASAAGAGKVASLIRRTYQEMYGAEAAAAIRILYGGSVTSENISEFIQHPDIDGALVGGASLKIDFVEIVEKSAKAMLQ